MLQLLVTIGGSDYIIKFGGKNSKYFERTGKVLLFLPGFAPQITLHITQFKIVRILLDSHIQKQGGRSATADIAVSRRQRLIAQHRHLLKFLNAAEIKERVLLDYPPEFVGAGHDPPGVGVINGLPGPHHQAVTRIARGGSWVARA